MIGRGGADSRAAERSDVPIPKFNVDRRDTLQALADVPDETWFCLLHAMRGVNLMLADTRPDDRSDSTRLEAAIAAELARLRPT